MSDIAGPYSSLKILHHPERIAALKRGEQIVPTHLEMVLSDLCNHDCSWCFPHETQIETPNGTRCIGDIGIGDHVVTPFGGIGTVTDARNRVVDELVEVDLGADWKLSCTAEHPLLTENGYVPAGDIKSGDFLVVKAGYAGEEHSLVTRRVSSVGRKSGVVAVYNLSVDPLESYIANGVVAHNCAYRWTGYTSNELFAKDVPLAQFGTNNPMRMMRKEKALEIIDDMVEMGIGALECTGGGEPTVHPDCVEIMKYALDKGLDVALVSNGELFRPGHIENLLRCKWVRFSLDAATPEVYAANRRIKGERMHRVIANIKSLADARKRYIADGNKCDLIIGIGFVLNKENWWEAAECAELAKSLGADNIRISAVFQPDDDSYFAEFYDSALDQCKAARALEGDGFRVFDNFGDRYQDLVDKNPSHPFCGYQQFTTYVGADESNFRCCLLAYSERGTIGSLKNQSLKELWASDKKREDFEKFDATQCQRCMFGSKLKTILYAIDTDPQHANFV